MDNNLVLVFNKTSEVIFKEIRSNRPIVFRSGNDVIQLVKDRMYLRIDLSYNINFTSHIVNLKQKVLKKITAFQKSCPILKAQTIFCEL